MKRFVTALCALMVAAPAFAEDGLVDRVERLEELAQVQIAGFYFGGSAACETTFPEADLMSWFPGLAGDDPALHASFVQGVVAAGFQNMANLPSKAGFCGNLDTYLKTLKD